MLDILKTEQRLCNRIDRLPDDWDFETQRFRTPEPNLDNLIFGASEYVKDGLLPLTEWLGASPWSERLLQLLDDILGHARIRTEVGLLPSTSHEVAGEMMQAIAAQEDSELHAKWRAPMYALLNRILEVGRDPQGLFFSVVNPASGEILNNDRTDNWGYNYMAFGLVAELDGVERYHEALRHVLTNLPQSEDYPWEGDSADGIADSLEGALTLLNRYRSGNRLGGAHGRAPLCQTAGHRNHRGLAWRRQYSSHRLDVRSLEISGGLRFSLEVGCQDWGFRSSRRIILFRC